MIGLLNKAEVHSLMSHDELWIGTSFVLSLIPFIVYVYCYMAGGRSGKWKRRYVGPIFLSLSILTANLLLGRPFMWEALLIYPLYVYNLSLGYGHRSNIWYRTSWFRRANYVLTNFTIGVLFFFLIDTDPWILAVHFSLCVVQYITGTKGILIAAIEEAMLAILMGVPMYLYFLNCIFCN